MLTSFFEDCINVYINLFVCTIQINERLHIIEQVDTRGGDNMCRSCRHESAVAATQRTGRELGMFFRRLTNRRIAREFNRAVRFRDARFIERLLGRRCRVIRFFFCDGFSCVVIRCVSGRFASNVTTVEICVRDERFFI